MATVKGAEFPPSQVVISHGLDVGERSRFRNIEAPNGIPFVIETGSNIIMRKYAMD